MLEEVVKHAELEKLHPRPEDKGRDSSVCIKGKHANIYLPHRVETRSRKETKKSNESYEDIERYLAEAADSGAYLYDYGYDVVVIKIPGFWCSKKRIAEGGQKSFHWECNVRENKKGKAQAQVVKFCPRLICKRIQFIDEDDKEVIEIIYFVNKAKVAEAEYYKEFLGRNIQIFPVTKQNEDKLADYRIFHPNTPPPPYDFVEKDGKFIERLNKSMRKVKFYTHGMPCVKRYSEIVLDSTLNYIRDKVYSDHLQNRQRSRLSLNGKDEVYTKKSDFVKNALTKPWTKKINLESPR